MSAYYLADGTRVTSDTVPTEAVDSGEVPVRFTADLYDRRSYGRNDPNPDGSLLRLFAREGTVVTQRHVDVMFAAPTVTNVSPAEGAAAGGTDVTITGTSLNGVTAVTFGGTAGTDVTVVSPTEVTVTTPAGTAGAVDVVVTDDGGTATVTDGFTYTA